MATTAQTAATKRVPKDPTRKTSLVAGIFYLITFVSIPTLAPPALYSSVTGKDFIISSGADTPALWGCFLEVIVALAGIGTAITLYPVVKRQNQGMALGFVASRTLEAAMLFTGVASILSLVTLHQDLGTATGADAATLVTIGASHVATYHWAFTLGGSLMPGINAILLGTLLYRSGLVPRVLPMIGLIGAPLHLTAVVLDDVRRRRPGRHGDGDRRHPDRLVGALAGRLSDRQRLQALPHHRCHPRRGNPARLPRGRRLSVENAAGPTRDPAASSMWALNEHPSRAGWRMLR